VHSGAAVGHHLVHRERRRRPWRRRHRRGPSTLTRGEVDLELIADHHGDLHEREHHDDHQREAQGELDRRLAAVASEPPTSYSREITESTTVSNS
jgi:phage terminase large subunit-like protein